MSEANQKTVRDRVPLRFTPIRTPHKLSFVLIPPERLASQETYLATSGSPVIAATGVARHNHRNHGSECDSPRAKSGQVAGALRRGLDPGTNRTQNRFTVAPLDHSYRTAYSDNARSD